MYENWLRLYAVISAENEDEFNRAYYAGRRGNPPNRGKGKMWKWVSGEWMIGSSRPFILKKN